VKIMEKNESYILNPAYNLKLDKNRVVIFNRRNDPRDNSFIGYVHPVYAILLSLFDGKKKLEEVETEISTFLKKDKPVVSSIISPLLENKEELHFHYDGNHFSVPAQLLVKRNKDHTIYTYDPRIFFIPKKDLDMSAWRLNSPWIYYLWLELLVLPIAIAMRIGKKGPISIFLSNG
jgi:hypothetical protein